MIDQRNRIWYYGTSRSSDKTAYVLLLLLNELPSSTGTVLKFMIYICPHSHPRRPSPQSHTSMYSSTCTPRAGTWKSTKIPTRACRTGILAGLPLLVRVYAPCALALLVVSTLQVFLVRPSSFNTQNPYLCHPKKQAAYPACPKVTEPNYKLLHKNRHTNFLKLWKRFTN